MEAPSLMEHNDLLLHMHRIIELFGLCGGRLTHSVGSRVLTDVQKGGVWNPVQRYSGTDRLSSAHGIATRLNDSMATGRVGVTPTWQMDGLAVHIPFCSSPPFCRSKH